MSAECNIVRVNTGDSTFCQNKTVCSVLQVAIYFWFVMDIHIGVYVRVFFLTADQMNSGKNDMHCTVS